MKPVQAYCKSCERLFCYFTTRSYRKYCSWCAEIERLAQLEFTKIQRRRDAAQKAREKQSVRLLARFPGGGILR